MKKFLWILVAAVAVAACGSKETPADTVAGLTVSPASLSFTESDTSTKFLQVKTSGDWTVTASDWIKLNTTSGNGNGSVSVSVTANEGDARTGSVDFVSGSRKASVSVAQAGSNWQALAPAPAAFDGTKRGSTTYQLLIYSFADSDGDGVGDFKGIQNKLDYLDKLGVTALWLSPIHPSDSYHGYDVQDYFALNPDYGTEQDFKDLLEAAEAKGIKIYMDYVLNHSGKGNDWFKEALADPSSKYRDYYFLSSNPSADYRTFPMLSGTNYNKDEWKVGKSSGSPRISITKTTEAETSGNAAWNLWLWPLGSAGVAIQFKDNGDGTMYLVKEIKGNYGILLRSKDSWDGSKFGAKTSGTKLSDGGSLDLVAEGEDISFTGDGRYKIEISNLSVETLYYMGAFSDWMPDLNYGAPADVENNATFKDLAASADKWINMGVDGLRLDAVKHICGGISSYNNTSNRAFLKKWYEHCNATYKAAGHSGNIFMVGECWDDHASVEKYYYEGLTSCFEFGYWRVLAGALNSGNASSYVSSVSAFVADHLAIRPDAVTSLFMTNHDKSSIKAKQNPYNSQEWLAFYRAADDLGRNLDKEKQAAAMMLSSPGKPFVYQGEELGYWRVDDNDKLDDEYLRAPIVWNSSASDCAKGWAGGKVDNSMLKGSISVETQSADENSLLNTYITWSRLRNTYSALASGEMTSAPCNKGSVAAWYMTAGSEKLLVIHNVASSSKDVSVADDLSRPVAVLGSAAVKDGILRLAANSSVVFQL